MNTKTPSGSLARGARKILVTSALPYANGPIHIGHAVEYAQTDMWVRTMRMQGHSVRYVCADDQHGAAIMVAAAQQGVTPEALVARYMAEHLRDFGGLGVEFSHYGATHCEENRMLSNEVYYALKAKGRIVTRREKQLFDEVKGMFLADRFVTGECPKCGATNQYGDNCEACGATYSPLELRNPKSRFSGATPVVRDSERHFIRLSDMQDFLAEWIKAPGRTDDATRNKVLEWFGKSLKDWDISRDGPYFGFEIPDAPGKFFYVWLDAPIGYMAATEQYCKAHRKGKDFAAIWRDDGSPSEYERYHFIGKDIAAFHLVFWPAMLRVAGFRLPDAVYVHGFLTVNGKKMSKRHGTFISVETWLKHLPPETLRYYFATRMGPGPDDIDLNLDDFVTRVNGDLVGKLINIAARTAPFIERHFDGLLAQELRDSQQLLLQFQDAGQEIAQDFEERRFALGARKVMDLADCANRYIEEHSPWNMAKDESRRDDLHQVCSLALNLFRSLMAFLSPIVPQLAGRSWRFLNTSQPAWAEACRPMLGHRINNYERLMERIDLKQVRAVVADSTVPEAGETLAPLQSSDVARNPLVPPCTLAQFEDIDMRVARITEATRVAGQPKIHRLVVDIGDAVPRVAFAAINGRYTSSELKGRLTVVVANLPPKEFEFGTSDAMIVTAAGNGDHEIFLLSPDAGARPGMRLM